MRPSPPLALEIALARAVAALSRGVGVGGGTTIPGKLLAELDRGAIDRLAARLPDGTAVPVATHAQTTGTAMGADVHSPRSTRSFPSAAARPTSTPRRMSATSATTAVLAATTPGHRST